MEDTPLHPDTDLVADILGQRPDVSVTHLKLRQKRQGQRLLGTTRWKIAQFLLFNLCHFTCLHIQDEPSCGGLLMAKVNQVESHSTLEVK